MWCQHHDNFVHGTNLKSPFLEVPYEISVQIQIDFNFQFPCNKGQPCNDSLTWHISLVRGVLTGGMQWWEGSQPCTWLYEILTCDARAVFVFLSCPKLMKLELYFSLVTADCNAATTLIIICLCTHRLFNDNVTWTVILLLLAFNL
jgi:hypothetical protein